MSCCLVHGWHINTGLLVEMVSTEQRYHHRLSSAISIHNDCLSEHTSCMSLCSCKLVLDNIYFSFGTTSNGSSELPTSSRRKLRTLYVFIPWKLSFDNIYFSFGTTLNGSSELPTSSMNKLMIENEQCRQLGMIKCASCCRRLWLFLYACSRVCFVTE